ncbi:hypothetical protein GCM10010140_71760 [Streptosporangium pseudovulgare]|uniref:Uncharacterized protein n=1 Tax=Streptosporangium pseudovulgare TaxID=35765 RepID=A0ABQ2RIX9_9ACTN|nr:hypothetical protein GCM10010140_71760 [Streptosporangium pseudovulgare]
MGDRGGGSVLSGFREVLSRLGLVAVQSLIHARGLVKRFGDFTAVDGIDPDVAPGEAFGSLGPGGAGKPPATRPGGWVTGRWW